MRLLVALLLALPLSAQRPLHVNADKDGLALYGYDVVAYHTLGAPTVGRADVTATWEGATWRFATAEHRDRFVKDPARYAPQYGGFCAYGVAGDYKVKIEPDAWRIVAGKLYLNYDRRVQERWSRDIAGYISKADANWPTLRPRARRD